MGGQKGIACFYGAFSSLLPVTLVSTKNNANPGNIEFEFLPILSNSTNRYYNPFLLVTLKKIIQERKSTHLILEHPYYGWLGILLKLFFKIKLVVHSHNIESLRFKSTGKWWWRILWQYEKFVHRMADVNFFITDEDHEYAVKKFNLKKEKCNTITYGFDFSKPPSDEEKSIAKSKLYVKHNIPHHHKILLFNGTLDYKPNLDAVEHIVHYINPILLNEIDFNYTIIICGKNLPSEYEELKSHQNIIYAGFVDDINLYFMGADIFINPVIDGGGIKTKLVEALGNNLCCISTVEGAIGVPENITNGRLKVVREKDWSSFAQTIIKTDTRKGSIENVFFNHFYWGNIAAKAKKIIDDDYCQSTL